MHPTARKPSTYTQPDTSFTQALLPSSSILSSGHGTKKSITTSSTPNVCPVSSSIPFRCSLFLLLLARLSIRHTTVTICSSSWHSRRAIHLMGCHPSRMQTHTMVNRSNPIMFIPIRNKGNCYESTSASMHQHRTSTSTLAICVLPALAMEATDRILRLHRSHPQGVSYSLIYV